MKRPFIAIALVAIVALGIFYTVTLFLKDENELPKETVDQIAYYTQIGTEQRELGAYGKACECFENVLALDASLENYHTLADVYLEAERYSKYTELLRTVIGIYPKDTAAYEKLCKYYFEKESYSACKEIGQSAFDNNVHTDIIEDCYYKSAFMHDIYVGEFENAYRYYNGFSVVKNENGYSFLNANLRIEMGPYKSATSFTDTLAAVLGDEGKYYYIDLEGEKYLATAGDYEIAYSFSEGYAIVKTKEGKYRYLTTDCRLGGSEFEYATLYKNGVAAVKSDGKWYIINQSGAVIEGTGAYYDVKYDEDNICSNCGIIFVSDGEGKGYYPINLKGQRIGGDTYDDAKPFFTDNYTCVMKNEKWGFMDLNGNLVIEYQYQDAQPFGYGAAAVKTGNKWGFIAPNNRVVIEPEFEGAKCFTADKLCPVKSDGKWSYLKLLA